MADLVHLAAEPQNQRGGDVRMVEYPGERALQLFGIGTDGVAAAFAVREGNDTVDVRWKLCALIGARDGFGCVRGAIAGRDHGDVVTGASPAIGALITKKAGATGSVTADGRDRLRFAGVHFCKGEILRMDMLAGCDRRLCDSDGVAVAAHGRASRNIFDSDFVPGGNRRVHVNGLLPNLYQLACGERHARDGNVVALVQVDNGVLAGGWAFDLVEHLLSLQRSFRILGLPACAR